MTIDYVGHFRQKIADIHADCGSEFDLSQAPDFALDSRFRFAAGVTGWAVSG